MIIKTKYINKKGVEAIGTVIESEKVEKNLNGKIIELGYDTIFNIECDGNSYTQKKRTNKFYEVGTAQQGIYIQNKKNGEFYLSEEGIYNGSNQNGLLILYLSGIPFFLALIIAKQINKDILYVFLFFYILAIAIIVRKSPKSFSRFKYENPESAKGISLKEFLKIRDTSNKEKNDSNTDNNESKDD